MSDPLNGYRESWGRVIVRILRTSLLIAAGLGIAAAVIAWVVGWRTFYLIGQAFWFAGVGSIGLGLLSTIGTWNVRGNFNIQYSRSSSHQTIGQRASQDMLDLLGSNAFMLTTLLAGVILILAGYVLQIL